MEMEISKFDGSEFLQTKEDQAEYLSEAFATGDPKVVANAIGRIARLRGFTDLARETKLNRATLYSSLGPDGNPTITTVMAVLAALDIKLQAAA